MQFRTTNEVVAFYGPQNVEYETGDKIDILYDKDDPGDYLILNSWGVYLNNSAIISAFLLILWIGIYRGLKLQKAEQELMHENE